MDIGISLYVYGPGEESVKVIEKWVSRKPSDGDAYALLGGALLVVGKQDEAIAMLEEALSLNPKDPQGWYERSLTIARVGTEQFEETVTAFREKINADPENADNYRYLSLALSLEGRYDEALSMAKKAKSLVRNTTWNVAEFYWCLGLPYLMTGQYEEAIAAYKNAIKLWPDYAYAHINLTASYSLAGRDEDARAEAAQVLKITPNFSLQAIAKNGFYNFKKAEKERLINALQKAGLK